MKVILVIEYKLEDRLEYAVFRQYNYGMFTSDSRQMVNYPLDPWI